MKYENQTLFLDGKLTKFTVPDFLHELSQYKGKKISTIDLSGVSSIDSAGTAFLDELILNLQEFKPQLVNMNEIGKCCFHLYFTVLEKTCSRQKRQFLYFDRRGTFKMERFNPGGNLPGRRYFLLVFCGLIQ
jgi:ABC-type transporter Mla MlaB component